MRVCILVSAFGMLISAGLARTPDFDPEDVVRQVGTARSGPSAVSREPSALTGEFLIDTSITPAPAPGMQGGRAVAFDGVNFLVAWTDERSSGNYDIYGARVTPAGTVLDPAGLVISQAAGWQSDPAVAFDGGNFLVVWEDSRGGYYWDLYGARVSPQGTVLDPDGFVISQAADYQWHAAVGFDGENFLVVWEDFRNSDYDIYGARVSPQGTVRDPSGFVISQAAHGQRSPALGFDGANFLVTWTDERGGQNESDVYGARVSPQGTVLDPSGFAISQAADSQGLPAISFDGVNFLVAWTDERSGSSLDIYGARVTPQGTVLDSSGFVISQAASEQSFPTLGFDGADFLVAWGDCRSGDTSDIYGARVTPQGTVLDPAGFAISQAANGQGYPALGFDGENSLVAWTDERSGSSLDIYGARVTPQGTVLDPSGFIISQAAGYQRSPALGFDGANFLVVWAEDECNGIDWDLYGARVTPQGTVLDPSGFVISQAAGYQWFPALGFDGANFLVVWPDTRSGGLSDIYGARVSPAGTVLDPSGFPISLAANGQGYPALGFDGANFLVVWQDQRSGLSDIYGARVAPQGTVLDPSGIVVSQAADDQYAPALGFDGANSLVVWEDYRSGGNWDLYGARVTPQGTLLDPSGFVISQAANDQYHAAVASDGASFLAAWTDQRGGPGEDDIYGARVTPAGVVIEPGGIAISTAAGSQYGPALAFDGADLLVTWTGCRSGSYSDIYGARVTPAGVVFDSGPVVRQEGSQSYPALVRGSGNDMFLIYQGWTGSVGGKTYNTQRIWGKVNPSPAVAETTKPEVRVTNGGATIVRRTLFLPERTSPSPCASHLLDVSGRKVMDLRPGANDVRALGPGVYFIREGLGTRGEGPGRKQKVVVTR